MNSVYEQMEHACGFLLYNLNTFIYCCKRCHNEFGSGADLEQHILLEHQDEKKHIEGIFVNDGFLDTALNVPPNATEEVTTDDCKSTEQMLYKSEDDDDEKATVDKQETDEVFSVQVVELTSTSLPKEESVPLTEASIKVSDGTKRRRKVTANPRQMKGTFFCEMCPDQKFSTLDIVRQHMKRHILNKVRKQCPKCHIKPRNLEKHMYVNHTEERPYKCEFCDLSYRTNNSRVIHMRSHTGERPFLCATCGKSFRSQDVRNKHHMRVHSKRLPHSCTRCERSFMNPSQLQDHVYAFHSDARPYTCEICGNSYSTRKYLSRHRQSHGEKIHSCKYCEKKFKTTETRRWHERTVHHVM